MCHNMYYMLLNIYILNICYDTIILEVLFLYWLNTLLLLIYLYYFRMMEIYYNQLEYYKNYNRILLFVNSMILFFIHLIFIYLIYDIFFLD